MTRTETKSMTVPLAAEGGGAGVAKFVLIRLDGRRRSLPARRPARLGPGWRGGAKVAGLRGPPAMPVTRSLLRSAATTRWPRAARRTAVVRPMPLVAPVARAVLSRARGAAAPCRGHASTLDGILDSIRPLSPGKFAGMAKPLARVLALLDILQAGGTRTLRELSDRLGVDERTVRRYVDHLLDLDVPVESVRGRYGGYRLAPGYRMPPLMLTDDEAVAVLLGLVGTRRATLPPDTAVAVESA